MVEDENVNEKVAINTKSIEGYVSAMAVVVPVWSRVVHVQGAQEVCAGVTAESSSAELLIVNVG